MAAISDPRCPLRSVAKTTWKATTTRQVPSCQVAQAASTGPMTSIRSPSTGAGGGGDRGGDVVDDVALDPRDRR